MRKFNEGEIYEFCFLDIDIIEHSKILKSNPPDKVEKALDEFEKYITKKVGRYNGAIWGWQGDGGLCVFYGDAKARDSLLCALDILNGLAIFNINGDKKPIDEEIKVRIGCHKGTAKYKRQHGRIHSVAINFTAHLQKNFAKQNSIAISEGVYSELLSPQKEKFSEAGYFQNQKVYKLRDEEEAEQTKPGIHAGELWAKPWTKEEEESSIDSIADSIVAAGWHMDHIVAILDPEAPGGAIVGGKLVALLSGRISPIPRLVTMCIEGREVGMPRVVTGMPVIDVDTPKILVVDDAAFSGRTLEVAYEAICQRYPSAEVKFATLAIGKELEEKIKLGTTPIRMEFPYKIIPGNRVLFTWWKVGPTGTLREMFDIQYPDDMSFTSQYLLRPWGFMEIFAIKKKAFVRILTIMPGHRLSNQKHEARDEYFLALDDGLEIELDRRKPPLPVRKGDYIMIPRGTYHRFSNRSSEPSRSLEIAFGDKYDQDDIERCEDDYGRSPKGDKYQI